MYCQILQEFNIPCSSPTEARNTDIATVEKDNRWLVWVLTYHETTVYYSYFTICLKNNLIYVVFLLPLFYSLPGFSFGLRQVSASGFTK